MKTKTDIPGFDKLVDGGIPTGKRVLLAGTPGTGKSIFALQFLVNGIKHKEKGLYVTFEQPKEDLISQGKQFGWNLDKLHDKRDVQVLHIPPKAITSNTVKDIISVVKKEKISRLVVDSMSALAINTPSISPDGEITTIGVKQFIYNFIDELNSINVTSLLITQTQGDTFSTDGVSEYVADGIILINYESLGGDFSRSLTVRKMRECKNNDDIHALEISSTGIVVHSDEL